MESPTWRSLSINARRIMDRLLLENFMRREREAPGFGPPVRRRVRRRQTLAKDAID
jgi:hypothetical protein